ncbi:MAG: hypothetical protein M3Y82_10270 [Verrucomicrobiota bacterium]|nr:hypothetical protein [Verrucomicrobiota bacterium]
MRKFVLVATLVVLGMGGKARAQIDPEKRQLFQLGYNQPIVGRSPISGYAFYYRNDPGFLRTNMTLRLAVAPIYLDSELGFSHALGEHTDLAIGLAGGGFADSYFEIREGNYLRGESFTGHGGEISASVYHLFNPGQLIPLNGIFRVSPHYSFYQKDSDTRSDFVLPRDRGSVNVRTGFRLGGREPTMLPALGMEFSGWYEGQFRTESGAYGLGGDRRVEAASHLFWGRMLFIYTLPEWKHNFSLSLTAGTSLNADRFSAYRIGGVLPLASEFPLTLPGYYYQEISARRFALLSGQYSLPLDHAKNWNLTAIGTVAKLEYLSGLEQPKTWNSGAGLGLGYHSPKGSWQIMAGYSYGFNAVRSHGQGGHSIGLLSQWDLEARHKTRVPIYDIDNPYKSRGLFRLLGE